ncbi:MAG: type II secretion system F family protein [Candidatus Eisenbacteria bacterium]
MPSYKYKARDRDGRALTGVAVADSEAEIEDQLARRDQFLVAATAIADAGRGGAPKMPRKELIALTSQLGVIVGSGLAILDGLEDIAAQTEEPALRRTIESVAARLRQGSTLSDAMAANSRVFGSLYVNTIKAGEETGNIVTSFERLVSYLEWEEEISAKVKQAAAYPIILTVLLGSVLVILVGFVLPRFGAIFAKKGFPLPLPTKILLATSTFLRGHWLGVLVGVLALAALFKVLPRTNAGAHALDWLKVRLPVVGGLTRKLAISRFAGTLSTTVAAGVDIIGSIKLAGSATGNTYFARIADDVGDKVSSGSDLAASLRETGVFPPLLIRMIGVGEKTGQLSTMLDKVSEFFDREIKTTVARLMTICEAAVTVAMGVAVAVVALSVFLPLYKMLALVKR